MDVIDDFLPEREFNDLANSMMGISFEWFYSDGQNNDYDEGLFMFTHLFYKEGTKFGDDYIGAGVNSAYYNLIEPCVKQLRLKTIRRIKANLTTYQSEHVCSGFHTDYKNITTAVYYVNSNNGYTEFKNGDRIESVANRAVIFDSNLEHQGVGCTDEKRRIVINFNYTR